MNAFLEELRALPTLNLCIYLFGSGLVLLCSLYFHLLKPAVDSAQELYNERSHLQRITSTHNESHLSAQVDNVRVDQQLINTQLKAITPDRNLSTGLAAVLENLHSIIKQSGLNPQNLTPGEVSRNGAIASVPISITARGNYQHLYSWLRDFETQLQGVAVSRVEMRKNHASSNERTAIVQVVVYGQ